VITDNKETPVPGDSFPPDNTGAEDQPEDDGEKKLADAVVEQIKSQTHAVLYTKNRARATPRSLFARR
jgi:hypothetical protein